MENADPYIDRLTHLPPAPTLATELLGLFKNPDRDLDRIVELISHDPALTVQVLKRSNSAALGGAEAVSDVWEAVSRLGFYEVYCVVAGLVGVRAMSLGKGQMGVDVSQLWRHSVVAAVASGAVAKRAGETEASAFTAGLLHDIGKLVFASVESARYAEIIKQTGGFGSALAQAEQSAFGINHAAIGARMLERWGLPKEIETAVLHHHNPLKCAEPFDRITAVIKTGNGLAHKIVDQQKDAAPLACDPDALELLQLTANDVPTLVAETEAGLKRVQDLVHAAS